MNTAFLNVVLQPGEYFVGDSRHRIKTLLGSCVSIALWEPALRIGAMSHFLLPSRPTSAGVPPDGRYGEEALSLMLAQLRAAGVAPSRCQAKIFGGGNMFPRASALPSARAVGHANGVAARKLVLEHGLSIHSESLFGEGHRQIIFDIRSGDVWVRQVPLGQSAARNQEAVK